MQLMIIVWNTYESVGDAKIDQNSLENLGIFPSGMGVTQALLTN